MEIDCNREISAKNWRRYERTSLSNTDGKPHLASRGIYEHEESI